MMPRRRSSPPSQTFARFETVTVTLRTAAHSPPFCMTAPRKWPPEGSTAVIVWPLPSRVMPSGTRRVPSVMQSPSSAMMLPVVVKVQSVVRANSARLFATGKPVSWAVSGWKTIPSRLKVGAATEAGGLSETAVGAPSHPNRATTKTSRTLLILPSLCGKRMVRPIWPPDTPPCRLHPPTVTSPVQPKTSPARRTQRRQGVVASNLHPGRDSGVT